MQKNIKLNNVQDKFNIFFVSLVSNFLIEFSTVISKNIQSRIMFLFST